MIRRTVPATWKHTNHALEIPAKRYRIGELVRCSPFSRQTIHNYTIMGLIREAEWTEGGHRLYDESVFGRLSRILELRQSKSLAEIRRILMEEERISPARAADRRDVSSVEGMDAFGHTDMGQPG
jgi:DNA-binding transcriptional MerR regulator